ncbi:MAG: hypothetical protein ACW98Y_06780 [Candidatus Thorarchaeota archaeon]
MSQKMKKQGLAYLICMVLVDVGYVLDLLIDPGNVSAVSYISLTLSLAWFFLAVMVFRQIREGISSTTESQSTTNSNTLGIYVGLVMIIVVVLVEGLSNPMSLISEINLILNLGAGILSILTGWLLG